MIRQDVTWYKQQGLTNSGILRVEYLKKTKTFWVKVPAEILPSIVGSKAKGRISKPVFQGNKHAKFSEKRTFLTP